MEIPLIKNRDFIIFGLQPWDIPIGSNCKNIAEEIARHNRVLYVNRPLDKISTIKFNDDIRIKNRIESIRRGKNVLEEISSSLWVFNPRVIIDSINFLPRGSMYTYLNKRNNKKLANEIKWACSQLGFKDPVLIVDNDFFNGLYLKEFLHPQLFVYYIRDFLLSQKYFIRHGHKAEPQIIQKADLVAANSRYLAGYAAAYNPNAADIGQGCDVEDFLETPSEIPDDISRIKYPIIGYCGSLAAVRLDLELIHYIAVQRPGWNIVLVGPEDDRFKSSNLHQQPNIHFLGSKQVGQLPDYIHNFNICINPQLKNQMTIGNYPRKVDEYLAAGKPVVATKTEAMEIFGEQVYLCDSKEEYIQKIQEALDEPSKELKKEARRELAKSHTWEASVKKLYQSIGKTLTIHEGR
jgi:teichuronic acid biosynthesis glycosyltransferase TuaH